MKKCIYLVVPMMMFWVVTAFAQTALNTSSGSSSSMNKTQQSESEEALFNTLNEALEENREMRAVIKEVKQALQVKTIESEDLKTELRKLEALALERNRELGQRVNELDEQIEKSKEAEYAFESEKSEFRAEKKVILEKSRQAQIENNRLRQMLGNAILEDEKQRIIDMAYKNGEVATRAQGRVTQLNFANQSYRSDLVGTHYEMGNLYFKIRDYNAAAKAYKKVIEYDPSNAWAYHNLAVIEDYYLNEPESAYKNYQMYLNYKPVDEEAAEVRRRVLDLNLLQKVSPTTPLEKDFDKLHYEAANPKL